MKSLRSHTAAAILAIAAALFLIGCAAERSSAPRDVTVSALVAEDAAVPGGTLTVGWRFVLADGWHLYTNGRSDSGLPPDVTLTLPDGWDAGPLRWPAGTRHIMSGGLLDHIYEHEVVLLQTVQIAVELPPSGQVSLTAKLRWLACRDACVPGDSTLTLTLPARPNADPSAEAAVLAAAERELSRRPRDGEVTAVWADAVLELAVAGAEHLEFHPAVDCGDLVDTLTDAAKNAGKLTLRFKPNNDHVGPGRGVLVAVSGDTTRRLILDIPATEVASNLEGARK